MRSRVKGLGLTCSIEGCSKPVKCKHMCATHYLRKRRTGSALTKVNPERQLRAKAAEISVADVLRGYGRLVSPAPHYKADFDLTVDGHLVDVKVSTAHTDKYGLHWFINFFHHGKLDETGKDFYILRLLDVPHVPEPVHLLFPAPLGRPTMRINMGQLLGRYASAIAGFYAFARGEFDRKEKVA